MHGFRQVAASSGGITSLPKRCATLGHDRPMILNTNRRHTRYMYGRSQLREPVGRDHPNTYRIENFVIVVIVIIVVATNITASGHPKLSLYAFGQRGTGWRRCLRALYTRHVRQLEQPRTNQFMDRLRNFQEVATK